MLLEGDKEYETWLETRVLDMVEHTASWAGDREIKAMSAVLQRPILILQPTKAPRGQKTYAEKVLCKHFTPTALPELQEVAKQQQSLRGKDENPVLQPFELLEWGDVTNLYGPQDLRDPQGLIVLYYNGTNHFEAVLDMASGYV